MSLTPGTSIGIYEIQSAIGKGGMGEVYRARDTKLKRAVAIKSLPIEFARDADRLARFQREAEALAALNHPYIGAIYGLEEAVGMQFLVLELVEGETLADRLNRGPIPITEALQLAKQIAEALETAHEKGITHRDLKPANIKITPDGIVKVLDFGLAKVNDHSGSSMDLTNSPTMMSSPGMFIGTAAYMSPEQAKGQDTDRTCDVWAFGCVLYEMLTGHAVFGGGSVAEILVGVMKSEPDWSLLPAETPETIRFLLRRSLQKERKNRFHDAADTRILIDEAQKSASIDSSKIGMVALRKPRPAWITLGVVASVLAFTVGWFLRPAARAPEMRLDIATPMTSAPASLAISPDGQSIVYSSDSQGQPRLWLRRLDSVAPRLLPSTEGATYPFGSADSRTVGFFSDGKLKRIDVDGGSLQTLANAPGSRGGTWNSEGVILFTPAASGPIFRVSATGGEPTAVTTLDDPQEGSHRFPQFLPGGRRFLYYVLGSADTRGVYIGDLDGSEPRRLFDADAAAVFAHSGHLLFVRQGTLFAQDFDAASLTLAGNPVAVAEQVMVDATSTSLAALSASAAGPIVYRAGSGGGERQFILFDRLGKEIRKVGDPQNGLQPMISPDGRRVAITRTVNGNTDLWFLDIERGVFSRFTSDPEIENQAVWSPDGSRLVFSSNRNGAYDLYVKPATGAGNVETLLATSQLKNAVDWSSDGRYILYRTIDPKTGYDLWVLPMDGERKPFPVVQTTAVEQDAQFSPDGKWVTYQSNETGRSEIYIQPFASGGKSRISTNGGGQGRWNRSGKEFFYIALDGRLMAVPVELDAQRQSAEIGTPVPLFATRIGGALLGTLRHQYAVLPDGKQFLMNTVTDDTATPITIMLNWKPKSD
jgi:serine/threonine protein kinase